MKSVRLSERMKSASPMKSLRDEIRVFTRVKRNVGSADTGFYSFLFLFYFLLFIIKKGGLIPPLQRTTNGRPYRFYVIYFLSFCKADFSMREICACDTPSSAAASVCVFPR